MMGRLNGMNAPVAVRLVDIDREMKPLEACDGYDSALVFFRKDGSIVAEALVPVVGAEIRHDILDSVAQESLRKLRPSPFTKTYSGCVAGADGVTVAVCTRDRGASLKGCLESIQALTAAPAEVIVVDNRPSTGETREIVKRIPSVRYAVCNEGGLDSARNLALRLATGNIVAFIDDDVRVHPDWLLNLVRNFEDPMVGVTTGITPPAELETEAQVIFERTSSFIKGFERRQFTAFNADPFHVAGMGAGSNMAIRSGILRETGLFDERLDAGTPTESGGDHEFFSRVLRRGYRIVYDPSAIAWHLHRRTEEQVMKTLHGYGVGVFAWWTRTLVQEREYSLLLTAPITLIQYHIARVVRSFTRTNDAPPVRYAWVELRGALAGPFAYIRSLLR